MKKILLLNLLLLSFSFGASLNSKINPSNPDTKLLSYAVFLETNTQREKYGVHPLIYTPQLSAVAKYHSNEMVKYNFLGHNDKNGNSFSKRMRYHKLPRTRLSENCATSFGIEYNGHSKIMFKGLGKFKKNGKIIPVRTYRSAAKNIVNNLINSKGHRKNILDSKMNKIGVGTSFYIKKDFNNMLAIKTTQIFSK